ncbi:MAG: hypothetical protein KDA61_00740 [Planctomycetales bacterium]|nr:hypothetical protein [Planctomycetales bacterium]
MERQIHRFSPRMLLLVAAICAVASSGCRSVDNAQVDLLERELRQQENYIYELEDYLLEYSEKLRECRCDSDGSGSLTTPVVAAPAGGASKSTRTPRPSSEPELVDDDAPSRPRRTAPTPAVAPAPSAASDVASPDADDAPFDLSDETPAEEMSPPTPEALEEPPSRYGAFDEGPLPTEAPAEEPAESLPGPLPEDPVSEDFNGSDTAPFSPADIEPSELEIGDDAGMPPTTSFSHEPNPLRFADAPLVIPHPADFSSETSDAADASSTVAQTAGQSASRCDDPTLAPAQAVEDSTVAVVDSPHTGESPRSTATKPSNDASPRSPQSLSIRHVLVQSSGDEEPALLVVLEWLDGLHEPIENNAAVSLMIMTTDAPGSYKPVDRWDFSSDEASSSWQSTLLGDGLHLQLPIGSTTIPDGAIELWARTVDKHGVKLLTKLQIDASKLPSLDEALAAAQAAQRVEQSAAMPLPHPIEQVADNRVKTPQRSAPSMWRAASTAPQASQQEIVTGFSTTQTDGGRSQSDSTSRHSDANNGWSARTMR